MRKKQLKKDNASKIKSLVDEVMWGFLALYIQVNLDVSNNSLFLHI